MDALIKKANTMNQTVIETINKIGENASKQWIETHDKAGQQVENGLKVQSNMITDQYDVII